MGNNISDRIYRSTAPKSCFDCGIETKTTSKVMREFGGGKVQATVCAKGTGCKNA
jgi:hypothetical protein